MRKRVCASLHSIEDIISHDEKNPRECVLVYREISNDVDNEYDKYIMINDNGGLVAFYLISRSSRDFGD